MSETPTPPTAAQPPAAAPPPQPPRPGPRAPKPPDPRGSLGLGIGLAWACLIGGYTIVGFLTTGIYTLVSSDIRDVVAIGLVLLPWVMMIGLIIWLATTGSPRTAAGVGLGIASIFGVVLLLLAACFGILGTSSFH
jgi:hypothetical protein